MIPLDTPVWSALTTRQREFAIGDNRALRFQFDVEPFAAAADNDETSLTALAALLTPGEFIVLVRPDRGPTPCDTSLVLDKPALQMVAARPMPGARPADAEPLGAADAQEMIALAELTEPGPFRARTHELGQFWGIRREGRLVAMAGERMKLPGFTELSGVCVHPDWRGHGFARDLSAFVAGAIAARGETPFLHVFADNRAAIRLYEQLGFTARHEMAIQAITRT
jgi:ribosomal protein S18 acetylase RimI-like enzyme